MPQNIEHIAINDLLGKPPGWLLRSGITLVFLIVIGALLLAAFIRYPDELRGEAVIQREQAPIHIASSISAPLDTLFYADGDTIQSQQIIGVLKSEEDWKEVLALERLLDNDLSNQILRSNYSQLGSLQGMYANWVAAVSAYSHFLKNNGLEAQLQAIQNEIAHTNKLIKTSEEQVVLLNQQIRLEEEDYKRHLQLAKAGAISSQTLEEKEKACLAIQERKILLKSNLIRHELKINQLLQQSQEMGRMNKDQIFELKQTCIKLKEDLAGQIQSWKERFLLVAPSAGYLVFSTHVAEKQLVNAGNPLFSIQPTNAQQTPLLAKIKVPAKGIGKINIGDRVVIHLDAYPEKEFGVISSKLQYIASLPEASQEGESYYHLNAPLEEPLLTNYGKLLPANISNMGTGIVITKDRSVLDRIFEQILNLIK